MHDLLPAPADLLPRRADLRAAPSLANRPDARRRVRWVRPLLRDRPGRRPCPVRSADLRHRRCAAGRLPGLLGTDAGGAGRRRLAACRAARLILWILDAGAPYRGCWRPRFSAMTALTPTRWCPGACW